MRPLFVISCALLVVIVACDDGQSGESGIEGPGLGRVEAPGRAFVGSAACAPCHEAETEAWRGSHHDLAMQPATEATVLGDFGGVDFEHLGTRARFFRRGDGFVVRTDGPDGEVADFDVAYVFGVDPLQQYLVKFEDGRVQALPFCWDSRPEEAGGQRWYHLYQDERIPHDDVLHWTGVHQNWNFMCADCHSTDLRRNFDVEANAFATTWAEMDVACEACHGPGSEHVSWARDRQRIGEEGPFGGSATAMGLVASLRGLPEAKWVIDKATGQAKRAGPRPAPHQVDACARCHARRTAITNGHEHGKPLLDVVAPALLRDGLYHDDGQILDEVYVWGSFMQSRMHMEGVVCSDCHDPHTAGLKTTGNGLCYRCHAPERFDVEAHHHHPAGGPGSNCVDCHMPHKTYMVVDPRRDHSLRVPRPDLTEKIGTPNACNGCHEDKSASWAADAITSWFGEPKRPEHYGEVFHGARRGASDAGARLAALARDPARPGIVRATALQAMSERGDRELLLVGPQLARHEDPLIRFELARTLRGLPQDARLAIGGVLVNDLVRAVRIEAARALAPLPSSQLDDATRAARKRGLEEYVEAQLANADRAFAWVNIGVLRAVQRRLPEAESAYRTAIRLDPRARDGWVNLADLKREVGDEAGCVSTLEEALERLPDEASVHHALGLAYVRQKRPAQARRALGKAWAAGQDSAQFGYVYGVALTSQPGAEVEGVTVLEDVHALHPTHRPTLEALISTCQQLRDLPRALRHARARLALDPGDPELQGLVMALQRAVRGG